MTTRVAVSRDTCEPTHVTPSPRVGKQSRVCRVPRVAQHVHVVMVTHAAHCKPPPIPQQEELEGLKERNRELELNTKVRTSCPISLTL